MSTYTLKDVSIAGNYPVADLLGISMDTTANKHGILTYFGLLPEGDAKRLVEQEADMQVVQVSLRGELEFIGYPQSVVVDCQNDHSILRVTLVTSSCFMDADPRDRFFQDAGRTFADILTESYDDSGVGSLVAIRGNESIVTPILAYRETDWEFSLRIAGKLGTVVIPNMTSEFPQLTLGVPKRQAREETNDVSYSVGRDVAGFRSKDAVNGVGYQNFLRYNLRSKNRYQLGDTVLIDGRALVVMRKTFAYEKGIIEEHYLLGHEEDFAVPFHHNQRIAGLELEGKVQDRKEQLLKLLLDIDAQRPQGAKTWFSYSPNTNNGMYSMPLVDEKVMLQWQSERDGDILAVRPDRKNGAGMPPPERHFLTEYADHMMMIPGKVEFINPVGNVTLRELNGMNITTNKKIVISAGRDVRVHSGTNIKVYSPERILTESGAGSTIDMIGSGIVLDPAGVVRTASKGQSPSGANLPERVQNSYINEDTAFKLMAATPIAMNPSSIDPQYGDGNETFNPGTGGPQENANYNPSGASPVLPYKPVDHWTQNELPEYSINKTSFQSLSVPEIMGRLMFHEDAMSKEGISGLAWAFHYNEMTRGYDEATIKDHLWDYYGKFMTSEFDAYYDPDKWINATIPAGTFDKFRGNYNHAMILASELNNGTFESNSQYNPFLDKANYEKGYDERMADLGKDFSSMIQWRPASFTSPAPFLKYGGHGFHWLP